MRIYKHRTIELSADDICRLATGDPPIPGITISYLDDHGEGVIVANTMETFTTDPDLDPNYICVFDEHLRMGLS